MVTESIQHQLEIAWKRALDPNVPVVGGMGKLHRPCVQEGPGSLHSGLFAVGPVPDDRMAYR